MSPERSQLVLVTGGAGYIGAVLVPMLLERGYRMRVVDRFYWGTAPLAPVLDRVEIVHADVRDLPRHVLDGVDAVVHLSGLSNDPTAEWAPEANWQMNAIATERLGEACRRQAPHVRLVLLDLRRAAAGPHLRRERRGDAARGVRHQQEVRRGGAAG